MESSVDKLLQSQIHFEELLPVTWKKSLPLELIPGKVEIWKFDLQSYSNHILDLYNLLDGEEKARSARFIKEKDRQMYILAKALLRSLLGKYLKLNPREISFEYSERKKPRLRNPCNLRIRFNVTHSGQCILIAVSDDEVGIDVEDYRDKALIKKEMDFIFDESEKSFINSHASPSEAYHKLWTRKEALLKGTSQGVIDEIKSIPSLDGTHLIKPGVLNNFRDWSVYSFEADQFCVASLAYTGRNKKLSFNELDEY